MSPKKAFYKKLVKPEDFLSPQSDRTAPETEDSHSNQNIDSYAHPQTASGSRTALTPGNLLNLQHTIGNQAVQRLLHQRQLAATPSTTGIIQRDDDELVATLEKGAEVEDGSESETEEDAGTTVQTGVKVESEGEDEAVEETPQVKIITVPPEMPSESPAETPTVPVTTPVPVQTAPAEASPVASKGEEASPVVPPTPAPTPTPVPTQSESVTPPSEKPTLAQATPPTPIAETPAVEPKVEVVVVPPQVIAAEPVTTPPTPAQGPATGTGKKKKKKSGGAGTATSPTPTPTPPVSVKLPPQATAPVTAPASGGAKAPTKVVVVQPVQTTPKGKKGKGGGKGKTGGAAISAADAAMADLLAELDAEKSVKNAAQNKKNAQKQKAAQEAAKREREAAEARDREYYPTGQKFVTRSEAQLWKDLELDKMPPNSAKNNPETSLDKTKRISQAKGQLLVLAGTDKADVYNAMFNLIDHTRFIRNDEVDELKDTLTVMAALKTGGMTTFVKNLFPALSVTEISRLVENLSEDGLTAGEVSSLIDKVRGIGVSQAAMLLNKLYSGGFGGKAIKELVTTMVKGAFTAQKFHDLVHLVDGKGITLAKFKELVDKLSKAPSNFDPTQINDLLVKMADNSLTGAEITGIIEGGLKANRPAASFADVYPTGQKFTDIATRNEDKLWEDLDPNIRLPNQTPGQPAETDEQSLTRIKLAKMQIKKQPDVVEDMVDLVFKHDNGQTPRPFDSVATEDGYGGHTADRHILNGSGTIGTLDNLADRVWFNNPSCPGKAGAFASESEADGVLATITSKITTNWKAYRKKIIRQIAFSPADLTFPIASKGKVLRLAYGGGAGPATQADWNARPHVGDPAAATADPNTRPLTKLINGTEVYARLDYNTSAPGGWYINSSWPQ